MCGLGWWVGLGRRWVSVGQWVGGLWGLASGGVRHEGTGGWASGVLVRVWDVPGGVGQRGCVGWLGRAIGVLVQVWVVPRCVGQHGWVGRSGLVLQWVSSWVCCGGRGWLGGMGRQWRRWVADAGCESSGW